MRGVVKVVATLLLALVVAGADVTERDWLNATDPPAAAASWRRPAEEADVTERDWLNATDPQAMLAFLRDSGKLSDRKARLFAVAVCRRVPWLLKDERGRQAVEVAEMYADGLADGDSLRAAAAAAKQACADLPLSRRLQAAAGGEEVWRAFRVTSPEEESVHAAAVAVLSLVTWRPLAMPKGRDLDPPFYIATFVADGAGQAGNSGKEEEQSQADLLRCVFGNPLRAKPAIDPAWLTWNGGIVRRLAEGIYDERAFDRLPILGDALADAGCDNEDLLRHCRERGLAHCRGCWAVDLILEKE
jgi:hypothetical protein